ncbi:MAG TPA: molybdopterin synthase sulfur carrier subunit [Sphingobacteriaceae bacterium]|nr:molybdopterin synthase sulfur carrier subunit [Sphingobacteriaceae bacterium]
MKIKVLFFGRLAAITGKTDLEMENIADTNILSSELEKAYPAFAGLKYIIAVDKTAISGNRELTENMTVALLPPFSGG